MVTMTGKGKNGKAASEFWKGYKNLSMVMTGQHSKVSYPQGRQTDRAG